MKKTIGLIAIVIGLGAFTLIGINAQEVADKVAKVVGSDTEFTVEKAVTGIITPEVKDEMEVTLDSGVKYDLDKKIQITTYDLEKLKNIRLNNNNEDAVYYALINENSIENAIIDPIIAQGETVITE